MCSATSEGRCSSTPTCGDRRSRRRPLQGRRPSGHLTAVLVRHRRLRRVLGGSDPTGSPASGWFRSKAGRSLRMRGIEVKLCRGGGHDVAHSSDAPYPHGSFTVTRGAFRAVTHTFSRNGSIDSPRIIAPTVETWLPHVNWSWSEVLPLTGRRWQPRAPAEEMLRTLRTARHGGCLRVCARLYGDGRGRLRWTVSDGERYCRGVVHRFRRKKRCRHRQDQCRNVVAHSAPGAGHLLHADARQHAGGVVHLGHQHAVPARRRPVQLRGVRGERVLHRRHADLRDPDGRGGRHGRPAGVVPSRHDHARRDDRAVLAAVGLGIAVLGVGHRVGAARAGLHVLLGRGGCLARRRAEGDRATAAASRPSSAGRRSSAASRCSRARCSAA